MVTIQNLIMAYGMAWLASVVFLVILTGALLAWIIWRHEQSKRSTITLCTGQYDFRKGQKVLIEGKEFKVASVKGSIMTIKGRL